MSKEERKVPELRFKGFHDDWEQRKLGELSEITKLAGFEFTKHIVYSNQGEIPAIRGLNVKNGAFDFSDLKYIDNSEFSKLSRSKLLNQDIVFTYVGTIGEAAIVPKGVNWYLAPNVARIRSISIEPGYLFQTLISPIYKNQEIRKWITSSSQPALSMENIRKFNIIYPRYSEQIKIGQFLKNIDRLITLHQRKINTLETQKNSYLNLLFPKFNEFTPRLRFITFNEEWEQRELKQISVKVTEKNKQETFKEVLTNSAELGIVSQESYFNKEIANAKNISGYYIVRPNDFVYNPRISTFAPVGPINRNTLFITGIMSPLYYVFRTKNISATYLQKYFGSTHWHRFMYMNGDSGARSDRFAIKDMTFNKMPIPYPAFEEQKSIGKFISKLDKIIKLHHSKLLTLKNLKQVYLNKMFI